MAKEKEKDTNLIVKIKILIYLVMTTVFIVLFTYLTRNHK